MLSYTQLIIIIGLKTDSLFKGASSGASSSVQSLKIWLSQTSKPINWKTLNRKSMNWKPIEMRDRNVDWKPISSGPVYSKLKICLPSTGPTIPTYTPTCNQSCLTMHRWFLQRDAPFQIKSATLTVVNRLIYDPYNCSNRKHSA